MKLVFYILLYYGQRHNQGNKEPGYIFSSHFISFFNSMNFLIAVVKYIDIQFYLL